MGKCGGKNRSSAVPIVKLLRTGRLTDGRSDLGSGPFRRRASSGAGRPAQRRDSGCRYTCRRCDPSSSGHGDDRDDVPTFRGELLVVEVPEFRVVSIDFLDFRVPSSENEIVVMLAKPAGLQVIADFPALVLVELALQAYSISEIFSNKSCKSTLLRYKNVSDIFTTDS